MNLRSLDLNLLVVLNALLEERSVNRASERIGLSQSATSHALERLRKLFDDVLLVRTATGMEPTPRAIALAGPLRQALEDLRAALEPPEFDPASAEGAFTIATQTYGTIVVLPRLVDQMQKEAPGIDLTVRSGSTNEILTCIDQGSVDVGIGVFANLPGRLRSRRLLGDGHVCLMRPGHVLAQQPLTMQGYAKASHVQISMAGAIEDSVDAALTGLGVSRRIAMRLPHGLATLMAIARSDMLASVTSGAAHVYAQTVPLCHKGIAVPVPRTEFRLAWNQRNDASPSQTWLRAKLVAIAAAAETSA